jgi:6 kDa early secretory antigenic target
MPYIKVDPERLVESVDALRSATLGIESELERLDAEVLGLQTAWSGVARDAYAQAQDQWRREMTDLNRMLSEVARRLAAVAARYTAAQQALAVRGGGA